MREKTEEGRPLTVEEKLAILEIEMHRLKVQYDLYFIGSMPRPPTVQRDALHRMIRHMEGVRVRNASTRFVLSNLVNKFNVHVELWNKKVRRREEGERVHPLAARAAHREEAEAGPRPPVADPARRPPRARSAPTVTGSWRVAAGAGDEPSLRGLYEDYLLARHRAGETRQAGYEQFAREIARQVAALRQQRNCEAVDFRIYCDGNKVKIKARPAS
jgi:hypothetical protein